jgi:hypothetical protein
MKKGNDNVVVWIFLFHHFHSITKSLFSRNIQRKRSHSYIIISKFHFELLYFLPFHIHHTIVQPMAEQYAHLLK